MHSIVIATVLASATTLGATLTSNIAGLASSKFRYLGRVNPSTNELTWPSTGIAFTFTGTSASVPIAKISGTNSVQIVVDRGAPRVIDNVANNSIDVSSLTQGQHTVEIRKKSEALYGSIFIGNPTTSGNFQTSKSPTRRIEIIGDSISVGYGLDGIFPCTNTAALEDGPKTYGALAAKALGADYSIVAWSGKGLIRNIASAQPDSSPLMPELWTRYSANDADNTYDFKAPVDIVVINLGTNDFSYLGIRDPINATEYTTGIVKFVKTIQRKYTKAQFFITSSPMLSDTYPTAEDAQHTTQSNAIKAAVAQIGGRAHFVDFPAQDGSSLGCDYHPSASTNQAMATILVSAIRGVVGW